MSRKNGFTLIETIVYIFLSMIIFTETVNLSISIYKVYCKNINESSRYNDIQNFYLNLDGIENKVKNKEISISSDRVIFLKTNSDRKILRYCGDEIVVMHYNKSGFLDTNVLMKDVKEMSVTRKGKIIYLQIVTQKGEKFICCI